MKIIKQRWEFVRSPNGADILQIIEEAGRTCYKSEDKITEDSAKTFVKKAIDSGHHSVIEHANVSVRIVTDRGVTHELVRHRLAAYSQESTRYCSYSQDKFGNEITCILPVWFYSEQLHSDQDKVDEAYLTWAEACKNAEESYFRLLKLGQSAQEARSVLPNSLKTEIVMTANVREWRHIFSLRCSKKAHPQIRDLMLRMLSSFNMQIPVIFEDIAKEAGDTLNTP